MDYGRGTGMKRRRSAIYTDPLLYRLLMRVLYGRFFEDRYRALAAEIPAGAQIVDLCCGDCYIFTNYLREKNVDYLGLDLSPRFVRAALKRGVQAREFDVWRNPIPRADIVLMQGSLYQFIPHADEILRRMLEAARGKVLIAEPVKNMSSSSNPLLAFIARSSTRPGAKTGAYEAKRFDRQSLGALFDSVGGVERSFLIPGGREMIGVFSPRANNKH